MDRGVNAVNSGVGISNCELTTKRANVHNSRIGLKQGK